MNVETWPLERVIPYARNPRKNAAVAKVAASLKEFGWRQPLVVDAEGVIVVGHTRWLAAQQLKLKEVPVHVATGLSPAQIKAYRRSVPGAGRVHSAAAAPCDEARLAHQSQMRFRTTRSPSSTTAA